MEFFSPALKKAMEEAAVRKVIPAETEILREGQYVKVIPLVQKGLIKVFTRQQERELLLYHIQPNESCIMSFSASLRNDPSQVYAVTEEQTTAILLPSDRVQEWIRKFPELNGLFYQQYNLRYNDLLSTINTVLFDRMDKRLLTYLQEKARLLKTHVLRLSHKQIANELGTAREVVSRLLKKLEAEGKVAQDKKGIEIKGL